MGILVNLDVMLARRKMSSGELAERVGITDEGRVYVDRLIKAYAVVSKGVQEVLEKGGLENG